MESTRIVPGWKAAKTFLKSSWKKYNIPTAKYRTLYRSNWAMEGLEDFSYPLVIKADGLCAGKGVVICNDKKEAMAALEDILEKRSLAKKEIR